jgi:hypothetical protein
LDFQKFEPRLLLAIEGVAVADYRVGMLGQESGWQYLWNAPQDWSPENPGLADTGSIEDPTSYRELIREPATGFWTPDGDLEVSYPSYNLRLGWVGGAPGAAAPVEHQSGLPIGDVLDRYAIAAYTVDRTGMYSISDSYFRSGRLTFAAADLDGTRCHVGDSAVNLHTGFLAGKLDETRIYNRLLDQSEIKSVALFRRLRFSNS